MVGLGCFDDLIYIIPSTILQPYHDLETRDTQSLKFM